MGARVVANEAFVQGIGRWCSGTRGGVPRAPTAVVHGGGGGCVMLGVECSGPGGKAARVERGVGV